MPRMARQELFRSDFKPSPKPPDKTMLLKTAPEHTDPYPPQQNLQVRTKALLPRSPFAARTGERCSRGGVGVADTSSQTRTARRAFRLNSGSWNSTWCRLAAISVLGRPRRSKPRIFFGAVRRARHENARSETKERVRRYDQYHQGAPAPRVRTRTHMRAQPCSLSSPLHRRIEGLRASDADAASKADETTELHAHCAWRRGSSHCCTDATRAQLLPFIPWLQR